ncbi:MAG: hypothetical protein D6746_10895 [Bacteroidetes bacterium]|nr:MAG: hypothetical protein D6746_10895 [Bacteroidota bacterium]
MIRLDNKGRFTWEHNPELTMIKPFDELYRMGEDGARLMEALYFYCDPRSMLFSYTRSEKNEFIKQRYGDLWDGRKMNKYIEAYQAHFYGGHTKMVANMLRLLEKYYNQLDKIKVKDLETMVLVGRVSNEIAKSISNIRLNLDAMRKEALGQEANDEEEVLRSGLESIKDIVDE